MKMSKDEEVALFINETKNRVAPDMSQELWDFCWNTAYKLYHEETYGFYAEEYDSIVEDAEKIVDLVKKAIEIYQRN